jgi:hypothetical protein
MIIFKTEFKEMEYDNMDWIRLVQGREQWQALVNIVMNFVFYKRKWNVFIKRATISFSR